MHFDKNYVLTILKDMLATDSPTGFTGAAIEKIKSYSKGLSYPFEYTAKGNGIVTIAGGSKKTIGLCVHVDTLGLMVRSVKSNGTLAFVKLGGIVLPTLDGEYCKIHTRSGNVYTGTILSNSPAQHVFSNADSLERTEDTMHVRLDEKVKNKSDVLALGISNGDIVSIEPKTVMLDNGFIKSRFLDDKLSVALVFGVMKYFKEKAVTPKNTVKVLFSTYEELGHGMAFLPSGVTEVLGIDMGCIGDDLDCTEHDVSICAKDSSGPYDYEMVSRLIELAKKNKVNYAVDIYPYYGSDVSAALRGGNDIRGALIGPGVHASHGMERSHYDAVEATMKLITLYLTQAV